MTSMSPFLPMGLLLAGDRARPLPTYFVELRKTAPGSNPEYAVVPVDADHNGAVFAKLAALMVSPSWKPAWTTREEPENWGLPSAIKLVAVAPANRELRKRFAAHTLNSLSGYEPPLLGFELPRVRRDVRFVVLGTLGSSMVAMWAKLLGLL